MPIENASLVPLGPIPLNGRKSLGFKRLFHSETRVKLSKSFVEDKIWLGAACGSATSGITITYTNDP
jgi:hypothetical protein